MSSILKKERRPSHEFLSELSISQKQRLSNQKLHLKLKLDKLDVQRRRSLDVIENERRQISAKLQQQHLQNLRFQQIRSGSRSEEHDAVSESDHPDHIRTPRSLEQASSRSNSVDLGKHGRRISIPTVSERVPRSAGSLRRRNFGVRDIDRTRNNVTPERVLTLAQRRHSDTSTMTSLNVYARSNGKGFSFSQTSDVVEDCKPTPRTPYTTNNDMPGRRMSMPVLFPSLNVCAKPKLQISRSLEGAGDTPRMLERRHSFNTEQFRSPRRYSTSKPKSMDTPVAKMAGMHGVMQRTSIFQIQENEAIEEV